MGKCYCQLKTMQNSDPPSSFTKLFSKDFTLITGRVRSIFKYLLGGRGNVFKILDECSNCFVNGYHGGTLILV